MFNQIFIIMAKIKGLSPSKMSGSVGDFTYRQTKYGTVVSEKIQSKDRKLPTLTQCRTRYQVTNLANLGSILLPAIQKGFQGAKNDLAAFISANYNLQPVFIPKYLAESKACIVVPCQLTSGSLPPVSNTLDADNKVVSNIAVGNLAVGAATTIAELSNAIINANSDWRDGDQLSLIVATQKVVTPSQRTIPMVTINKYEFILGSSPALLSTVIPASLLSTSNGFLSMSDALVNQGAGFVHSRTIGGEIRVSTAFMVANNAVTISAYNTTDALLATADSYGGYRKEPFLSSNDSNANITGPGQGQSDNSNPGGQGGGSETTHTLTFGAASANGSVYATRVDNGATLTSPATVAEGTQVRLQANAYSGYVFSKWNDNNTSNPRIVTVSEDKTYTASFVVNQGGGDGPADFGD